MTTMLAERIEERLVALEMTPRAASLKTGRGPDVIRNILRGIANSGDYSPRTDTMQLVASVLQTTPEWLLGGTMEAVAVPIPMAEGTSPPPEFLGERDLPVFAAVEGGPGVMVVSTDPIELVPRPWFLKQVKEGYAVLVIGESMIPAYEPGDMAIVNPRLPAIRGKHAIFVSGEADGEFRATIKRLLNTTPENWKVEQYNPPAGQKRELLLPKKTWTRALRVVGKYEGG